MMTHIIMLEGATLALWVARALKNPDSKINALGRCVLIPPEDSRLEPIPWAPHENWVQGGALIQSHCISIEFCSSGGWHAGVLGKTQTIWRGPPPMIAAMRALVASVYGETVPDEVSS